MGTVEGARWWRDRVCVGVGDGDASDGNPWVTSHGTHTHESVLSGCGYRWTQKNPWVICDES